jgi:hypothetical protein
MWLEFFFEVMPFSVAFARIESAFKAPKSKFLPKVEIIPSPVSAQAISIFLLFPLATIIDCVSSTACSQNGKNYFKFCN